MSTANAPRSTVQLTGCLDDWGLAPLGDRERRDLLEIVGDRAARRARLATSQLPIEHWHDNIGNATFGDAILNRRAHRTHRISLTGGPPRRVPTTAADTTQDDEPHRVRSAYAVIGIDRNR